MSKLESVVPWTKNEEPSKRVQLMLHLDGNETDIHIANKRGETVRWLATIGPEGLRRARDIPADVGFPLDDNGRIKLDES